MTGSYGEGALPRYLREDAWQPIRERLDRVHLLQAPVQDAPGRFDAYNLSDIFEYMSPETHAMVYAALVAGSRPGARLAYWNMLAPRAAPAALTGRVLARRDIAVPLFQRDNAWFYSDFHVDEVLP